MAAAVKNADKVHNMDTPGSGYSGVRPHKVKSLRIDGR